MNYPPLKGWASCLFDRERGGNDKSWGNPALSHHIEIRGELIMTDTVKCRICVISGDTPEAVAMLVDAGTLGEVAETYLAAKGFYDELGEVVLETYDAETGKWGVYRVLN